MEHRAECCCLLHRDREAGESVHAGTGWTLGRRSLQLWRAGGIFAAVVIVCGLAWPAFQLKLDHVCCCVFAADASCAGVPEEHRQAVAH